MNPYQIVGLIAGCSLVFSGVVALLAMQGMPVMLAFLLVYAVAFLSMVAMQRRARQSCEGEEEREARERRAFAPPEPFVDRPSAARSEPLGAAAVGDVRY